MNLWLVIVIGGLLTYALRLSFIAFFGQKEIPTWLQRSLRYVPPAVLSAIIFPELLLPSGTVDLSLHNTRLLAGLLATIVAWRTRNALLTILSGMVALLLLQTLL
ncbi:MAG: AzlD domain-containing protein [Anaerolineales bacterium]|jgi:branched-subunit amino acid transport protein